MIWETFRIKLKKHSVTKNCSDLSLFEWIVLVISKFFLITRTFFSPNLLSNDVKEKLIRGLWIAWNIVGSVNYQKIQLLTIIYLYLQDYFHHPFNWMPADRFEALFRISYTYPCSGRCTSTSWRYELYVVDLNNFWPFLHICLSAFYLHKNSNYKERDRKNTKWPLHTPTFKIGYFEANKIDRNKLQIGTNWRKGTGTKMAEKFNNFEKFWKKKKSDISPGLNTLNLDTSW